MSTTTTECRALNPSKCRYHSALTAMTAALKTGDYEQYESARHLAEKHLHDKERKLLLSHTPSVNEREQELARLAVLKRHPTAVKFTGVIQGGRGFVVGKTAWGVAAEKDDSGASCLECHKVITRKSIITTWDGRRLVCPHCNESTIANAGEVSLIPQALENFDPEVTKKTVWYHATTDADWHNTISADESNPPVVHAGTKLAAWMRAKTLHADEPGKKFYLYEVHVNHEAEVSSVMYDDEDEYGFDTPFHPKTTNDTDYGVFETTKVMRYVNWWEESGSVSIMANSSLFTTKNRTELDLSAPFSD